MLKKTIVKLLGINTNVYVFSSGILVSLSTNIFTALCDTAFDIAKQWAKLSSSVLFTVAGAISMVIAVGISNTQDYCREHKIKQSESDKLIEEVVYNPKKIKWQTYYLVLALSLVGGIAMLFLNWWMI